MVREASIGKNVDKGGSDVFVADLLAYFTFPLRHILGAFTAPFYRYFSGPPWEATVYLGFANIGIFVWWLVKGVRSNREPILYLTVGIIVFAALASGLYLHVLGRDVFPMPDLLLSKMAFFRNISAPSRAIVFVYLFLSVAVSLGMQLLLRETSQKPQVRYTVAAAALVLIGADFYPINISSTQFFCSPGFSIIRNDPERGFGILNLPLGYVSENAAMAEQICHGRPIVGGNTSRNVGPSLRDRLATYDLNVLRRQLVRNKVKYVILHRPRGVMFRWRSEDGDWSNYPPSYKIVYQDVNQVMLKIY
jgi:hypothetical protein